MNETAHGFDIEMFSVMLDWKLYKFKCSYIKVSAKRMLITIG